MESVNVKLVVYVPVTHAELIRETLAAAGAGVMGNYDFVSFSVKGVGRFRGNENSQAFIGTPGVLEAVEEERIEVILPRLILKEVISKMKAVHPYEEVAFDVYALEEIENN